MGGGGAMRAAAKVATLGGAFKTGFRPSVTETPVTLSARKAARPVSATVCSSTTDDVKVSVQRPAWEIDEWEFAGGVGDNDNDGFVVDRVDPGQPRFVFGGPPPSFEETKEATSELKDALDKVYLSSPGSSDSTEALSSPQETKDCITHESSVPKGALQAFKLLKESPAAQTVVASIACDPNVWTAVLQNPTLVEFLQSDKMYVEPETELTQGLSESSVDNDDAEESGKPDVFMSFFEGVKVTVVDMVNSLTNFVEGLFAVPDGKEKSEGFQDTSKTVLAGGSFMALAMMVIMVVLMKRG